MEPLVEEECTTLKLGFVQGSIDVKYEIGTSLLSTTLPELKQEPDCGFKLSDLGDLNFIVTDASEAISALAQPVYSIDAENWSIDLDTENFTIAGASLTLEVGITLKEGSAVAAAIQLIEKLTVTISFGAPAVELDLSAVDIKPLKCGDSNEKWELKVPKVKFA